jgi:hypothetical protein
MEKTYEEADPCRGAGDARRFDRVRAVLQSELWHGEYSAGLSRRFVACGANDSSYGAYAQATGSAAIRSPHTLKGFDGTIEGDPDLNIVFQLHREAEEGW